MKSTSTNDETIIDFNPSEADTTTADKSILVWDETRIRAELRKLAQSDPNQVSLDLKISEISSQAKVGKKPLRLTYQEIRNQLLSERQPAHAPPTEPTADELAAQQAALEADTAERKAHEERESAITSRAIEISKSANILTAFKIALKMCTGYIADDNTAGTIALSHAARLMSTSMGFLVCGSSASGKTELVVKAARFLPEDTVIVATACTPKALFYLGDIKHKYFVGGELKLEELGKDDPWQQAFRQLISDNKISLLSVEKDESGKNSLITKTTEGPAAFIQTTTLEPTDLNDEYVNRLSIVRTDDSDEMTRKVLKAQAHAAAHRHSDEDRRLIELELAAWQRFHAELPPRDVIIPFAEHIEPSVSHVTMRRVSALLHNYIRVSALLHQVTRAIDEGDRIIATIEDYKTAHKLITETAPKITEVLTKVHRAVLKTIMEKFPPGTLSGVFTVTDCMKLLGKSESQVRKYIKRLRDIGCIETSKVEGETRYRDGKIPRYQVVADPPLAVDLGFITPEELHERWEPKPDA
jgi:hypothetical protein